MGGTDRPLGPADAGALMPLVEEAGWNQTPADWRLILGAGRAVGAADADGRVVGTAAGFPLGNGITWVSMVLVLDAYRRQGIATRLVRTLLDAPAGLDATAFGRPVYARLGFRDLYGLTRWRCDPPPAEPDPPGRPLTAADLPAVAAFDRERTGLERAAVLADLLARAPGLAFVTEAAGRVTGFVLGRPGRVATQVGPVVADDVGLLRRALAAAGGPVFVDVPDAHADVARWLAANGAAPQRAFVRMALGDVGPLADAGRVLAAAGPDLG
jgi:GNAT superfamily N-acetyltransferase